MSLLSSKWSMGKGGLEWPPPEVCLASWTRIYDFAPLVKLWWSSRDDDQVNHVKTGRPQNQWPTNQECRASMFNSAETGGPGSDKDLVRPICQHEFVSKTNHPDVSLHRPSSTCRSFFSGTFFGQGSRWFARQLCLPSCRHTCHC